VISGSHNGTARQWDVENRDTILGPIETGHEHVYAVVYSPDMTMFATAGRYKKSNHPIKIWDAKTGKLVATLNGRVVPSFDPGWRNAYLRVMGWLD
jgi:WD40 repeat protein